MSATATKPRPTIAEFQVGTPYSTGAVAAFFGFTRQWVVQCCLDGRFPNAFKPMGSRVWMIPGQDIRAMYGRALIEKDRIAAAAGTAATETQQKKSINDVLKRPPQTKRQNK